MARKGKYAAIVDKLPRLPSQEEPDRQEKLDAIKRHAFENEPRHASWYAAEFARLRKEKTLLEEALKDIELGIDAYAELLINQYEVEGITTLSLSDGGTVRVQEEPHAIVTDREAHRLWCIKQGLEQSMFLSWNTTNAMTKQLLLQGENEPAGVTAYHRSKPVFTKG